MLDPRDRQLLLEALRPPAGHRFDRAIGTTYSLDPTALLSVPLAFAAFDVASEERQPHDDSLALLEAVRRNAARITLFCQAGRIAIPGKYRSLLAYLEKSVVEVTPRREGFVFHPKVWLVRYVADGLVTYRFLCLTRNLTFDRSWDTVLALEGPLVERANAYAVNHPLGDFVAALPRLAVRDVRPSVWSDVALMEHEVRRVKFAPPWYCESFAFLPLGLGNKKTWAFPSWGSRGLVVSPFLSAETLGRLPECRDGISLLSRVETLSDMSPSALERFRPCYVLSDMAEPEPSSQSEDGSTEGQATAAPAGDVEIPTTTTDGSRAGETAPSTTPLSGLHAKLFVIDEGWDTRVWTGSANATWSAFNGNVEFLVELRGKRSNLGVAKILGVEGKGGLVDLLEEFHPAEPEPADAAARELDRVLDDVRTRVAARPLRLSVERASARAAAWRMSLIAGDGAGLELPSGVRVTAWPISLSQDRATACEWGRDVIADFGELSLEALTPFVALAVHATTQERDGDIVFVLNLPMDGEPAGRDTVILRQMLRRPADLIALLLLLLAEDQVAILDALSGSTEAALSSSWLGFSSRGLFEALVRTLARDPAKLRTVKRLVDDLHRAGLTSDPALAATDWDNTEDLEWASIVPEGFAEIWEPIWQAALELGVRDVDERHEGGVTDD